MPILARTRSKTLRPAEISELEVATVVTKDVVWLDIAMNNPSVVHSMNRAHNGLKHLAEHKKEKAMFYQKREGNGLSAGVNRVIPSIVLCHATRRNVLNKIKQISSTKLHDHEISLFARAIGKVNDIVKGVDDGAHESLCLDVCFVSQLFTLVLWLRL